MAARRRGSGDRPLRGCVHSGRHRVRSDADAAGKAGANRNADIYPGRPADGNKYGYCGVFPNRRRGHLDQAITYCDICAHDGTVAYTTLYRDAGAHGNAYKHATANKHVYSYLCTYRTADTCAVAYTNGDVHTQAANDL